MAQAYDPERAVRNRAILDDRIKGFTYRQLAEKYNLSDAAVHGIVKDYSEATIKPAAEELVQLEIDRLERLLERLDAGIEAGNVRSIETAIKLSESLRRLTGVDAAIKLTVEHSANSAITALEEKIRKATQINAKASE